MPKKKRVQVSFSDHTYATVQRYAEKWDVPMSTAVMILAVAGAKAKDHEETTGATR